MPVALKEVGGLHIVQVSWTIIFKQKQEMIAMGFFFFFGIMVLHVHVATISTMTAKMLNIYTFAAYPKIAFISLFQKINMNFTLKLKLYLLAMHCSSKSRPK